MELRLDGLKFSKGKCHITFFFSVACVVSSGVQNGLREPAEALVLKAHFSVVIMISLSEISATIPTELREGLLLNNRNLL